MGDQPGDWWPQSSAPGLTSPPSYARTSLLPSPLLSSFVTKAHHWASMMPGPQPPTPTGPTQGKSSSLLSWAPRSL